MRRRQNLSRTLIHAACGGLGVLSLACGQPGIAPAPLIPPLSYDSAVARIARRQLADDSVVVTGGRSILLTHGARAPRVIVLLHGFTDAPMQFEALGRQLFAAGDNVYIPRLPHHAERVAPVRGGNPGVVLPVLDSLVDAATPPATVELLAQACDGPWCALRHAAGFLGGTRRGP